MFIYYTCLYLAENQQLMAKEGGIEMLVSLLDSSLELTQRQSAKALANLGVNPDNKRKIADVGGIPKLIILAGSPHIPVRIEAIAALANLAVNDANELDIVRMGGLEPIVNGAALAAEVLTKALTKSPAESKKDRDLANIEELGAQCSRALRNLSVNPINKITIQSLDAATHLNLLIALPNERIAQQV